MKKIILVFSLLVVATYAQFPAPSGLSALTGLPGRIQLNWTPPPPVYPAETLYYDNGIPAGFGNLDSGYYSVRFSPAGPCSVIAVQVYFLIAGGTRLGRIHYWPLNEYGLPDYMRNLFPPKNISVPTFGWNEFDVSGDRIVFDGLRDFFIGFSKRDAIPEFGIAYDSAPTIPQRSYLTGFFGHYAVPGDLLVRLVVMNLSTRSLSILSLTERTGKFVVEEEPFYEPTRFASFTPIPEAMRSRISPEISLAPITPSSYSIFRSNVYGAPLSFYATVPGTLTTYNDYSVMNGQLYFYTIRADFPSGYSDMPETVWATPYSGTAVVTHDTLKWDDGIPNAGVHWNGAVLANKFTSPMRSKLIRIEFHINTIGSGIPRIYLNERGLPGRELLGLTVPFAFSSTGWRSIPVDGYNIFVDGDFWVGLQMSDAILGLSIDLTRPGHGWDLPPGGVWEPVADSSYMIRAITQYSTGQALYEFHRGWNAISLPIIPSIGLNPNTVFSLGAGFLGVYKWNANTISWEVPDMLLPGHGYFVLCTLDANIAYNGIPVHDYYIPYAGPGWEFIGGMSRYGGADTTAVTTTPPNMWIMRHLYHWDSALRTWSTKYRLYPSQAYFIYLNSEGLFQAHE